MLKRLYSGGLRDARAWRGWRGQSPDRSRAPARPSPAPIYNKWAQDYGAHGGDQLNYQSIGSGGGIKKVEAKTVDFGATDMPLSAGRPGRRTISRSSRP